MKTKHLLLYRHNLDAMIDILKHLNHNCENINPLLASDFCFLMKSLLVNYTKNSQTEIIYINACIISIGKKILKSDPL
jgi:hypothetical protein